MMPYRLGRRGIGFAGFRVLVSAFQSGSGLGCKVEGHGPRSGTSLQGFGTPKTLNPNTKAQNSRKASCSMVCGPKSLKT